MADYKSDYLNSVLESYKMKHIEELINTYRTKRDEIKQFLNKQYGNNIYEPFNSGSYKNTRPSIPSLIWIWLYHLNIMLFQH